MLAQSARGAAPKVASLQLAYSLTHSLSHSLTLSLTLSLSHSLTHSLSHSLTLSPSHSLTHSLACSLAHSLTHSLEFGELEIGMSPRRRLCSAAHDTAYDGDVVELASRVVVALLRRRRLERRA